MDEFHPILPTATSGYHQFLGLVESVEYRLRRRSSDIRLFFLVTANVVEDIGAKPIFVDVNLDTSNMNVGDLISIISQEQMP